MRLGTWVPSFEQARRALEYFTGTRVSAATIRRLTEGAGAAYEAVQTAAVEEVTAVAGNSEAETMQVSADGAMVPLVGGEWAEVKTLAVGRVETNLNAQGLLEVHTRQNSYFSRLIDAERFGQLAIVELRERKVLVANTIVAPTDGALWIQGFLDSHVPRAVRILDFPHAASYLARAAQAFYGAESPAAAEWFATQRHELKSGDPRTVIEALRQLQVQAFEHNHPEPLQAIIDEAWNYLRRRLPMLQYATFQALGYPIGSGATESANKLVVERRLKGPGMHWQRQNVNPMLALCNAVANDRWDQAWKALLAHRRAQRHAARTARRAPPRPLTPPPLPDSLPPPDPKQPYRPRKDHPWRHQPIGRARRSRSRSLPGPLPS